MIQTVNFPIEVLLHFTFRTIISGRLLLHCLEADIDNTHQGCCALEQKPRSEETKLDFHVPKFYGKMLA